MIRCDTEAERKALADMLWAVHGVISGRRRKVRDKLNGAFDRLFDAGLYNDAKLMSGPVEE